MHALIKNNAVAKYPYSIGELKRDNPQTSFPKEPSDDLLATFGMYTVQLTEPPACDATTQVVSEGTPVEVNGVWTQQWVVREKTAEEMAAAARALQNDVVAQTQQRLDTFAQTRKYDGILSACTYATSAVLKFRTEGQYCVDARDNTWATLYQLLAEVEAGTRPIPSGYAEIEPLLPVLQWPV